MIEGKTIKFGYGDIIVSSRACSASLVFTYVKPPFEIGYSLTEEDYHNSELLDSIEIKFLDLNKASKFKSLLDNIDEKNTIIEFDNYIFDFSNYNKESVNVVKRGHERLITSLLMCYAC